MISTSKNPLAFFEYIIDENNIKKEIERLLHYSDFVSIQIEFPHEISYIETDEFGDYKHGKIQMQNVLSPMLYKQKRISMELMRNSFYENTPKYNRNFLLYQFSTIQDLIKNRVEILNKYPYFLFSLRGLVHFMNSRLLYPDMKKFELKEEGFHFVITKKFLVSHTVIHKNMRTIYEVLSYMEGKNEKQETILSKDDFSLLIEYTSWLIDKEELPKVHKKLKPELNNDLISFSYWVLHKELYDTKKIRKYFYEFIKSVFENFENFHLDSIKSSFGSRTRTYPHEFLPEIIKNYIEKSPLRRPRQNYF